MKKAAAVSMVWIALAVRTAAAQEAALPPAGPSLTATAGAGNSTGGLGGQVAAHFAGGRAAAVLGVGYVPRMDQLGPSGLALTAGVRVYDGARPNRPFLELSRGVVAVEDFWADGPDAKVRYGPVVLVGYEWRRPSGLTILIGAGVGVAGARSPIDKMRPTPAATFGIGHTWRRK
jgi:hypothetical protein